MRSGMNKRQSKVKYLTQDQVIQLFSKISYPRDKLLFNMMYKYGLRASEARLLTWDDIDLKENKIWIERLKGGISGMYNLFPDTLKLLQKWSKLCNPEYTHLFTSREKKALSRSMLDYLFKHYSKGTLIPIDKRHCHTLRHSIAVHMLDAGRSQEEVKDHLGHKYIQSTNFYAVISSQKRNLVFQQMLDSSKIVEFY